MLKIVRRFISEGVLTNDFPLLVADPPDGFLGKPVIDFQRCTACDTCAQACPTGAIRIQRDGAQGDSTNTEKIVSINYGDCIFCGECAAACPDAISMTKEFQLATTKKEHLITQARHRDDGHGIFKFVEIVDEGGTVDRSLEEIGARLRDKIHRLLGRSLNMREVDAGSCNGCEVEITGLNNPVYDIERFGIHFVASPRHADMLLVTGPVTRNMEIALKHTFDATPNPKIVVAVGACAIGGGIFGRSYASCGGVDNILPVDVFIPGCPPRPEALLHGILLAVGRLSQHLVG